MSDEPTRVNVLELARLLEARKIDGHATVLLLGAKAGGLYRSRAFVEAMRGFSSRDFTHLTPQEQLTESYQVLNQLQPGEYELDTSLRDFLREVKITEADICLAELIKQEVFNTIISTNIDDLLEYSLNVVEMKEPDDFGVVLPEQDFVAANNQSDREAPCQIIKAFGDLESSKYRVVQRETYFNRNWRMRNLLRDMVEKDIIIVGLDPVWDGEILRLFSPEAMSNLWFVNEESLVDHPLVAWVVSQRQDVKYVVGKEGLYEAFFKTLHWHLTKRMPINYQFNHDVKNSLQSLANDQRSMYNEIHKTLQEQREMISLLHREINEQSSINSKIGKVLEEQTDSLMILQQQVAELKKNVDKLSRFWPTEQ